MAHAIAKFSYHFCSFLLPFLPSPVADGKQTTHITKM